MKPKRNQQQFAQAESHLQALESLANQDWLDVYFYDESGFSLTSCLPYAWQEKGKQIELLPAKGKRINVAGFYSKTGEFIYQTQVKSFKQEDLIPFFDRFCASINKRTIVVLDNAPTHHGKAFQNRMKEWQQQDLFLYFLPPYSPELNAIEMIWRNIKYQWLDFKAFLNFENLTAYLLDVLNNINIKYSIIFV